MTSIENLTPDQRAVLELVLERGRSYDEIARVLSIDRAGVRERALAAFDALGPQTRVAAERRALITDYLLGALPAPVAEEVRDHLAQSASERAWARVIASELQELAREPLPEIPVESGGAPQTPPAMTAATAVETPVAAEPSNSRARARRRSDRPSSRVGGAVVLAGGALVVVAVVLVLLLSGGSSPKHSSRTAARPSTTTTTSTTGTNSTKILSTITLKPPTGGTKPVGIAEVLKVQGKVGIAIVAQNLTANSKSPPNAYAVWLSNSPTDSKILGFVSPAVTSNGQMRTAGPLPTNAHHYQKLLLTLETQSKPKTPGPVILEGALTGV
jgi:Sigma-70, region 4